MGYRINLHQIYPTLKMYLVLKSRINVEQESLVGAQGLEPRLVRLEGGCFIQLSYTPSISHSH